MKGAKKLKKLRDVSVKDAGAEWRRKREKRRRKRRWWRCRKCEWKLS